MTNEADWDAAPLAEVLSPGGTGLRCSLEEAALVLARQEYPGLGPAPHLVQLDDFAARVRSLLSAAADAPEVVGAVNDVLFRDLGFRGNADDYYDDANSFLNQVIERRTGIPITLSVVYAAVARRAGLALRGTGFPGHFLLTADRPGWPIVIDAFGGGRILSHDECEALAGRAGAAWNSAYLDPVPDAAILRRILNNLQAIYFARRDWARLARTVAQILALDPTAHDVRFARGIALAGVGEPAHAAAELETYLRTCPGGAHVDAALDLLCELRRER